MAGSAAETAAVAASTSKRCGMGDLALDEPDLAEGDIIAALRGAYGIDAVRSGPSPSSLVLTAGSSGFAVWLRRSGRELPERVEGRDLALIGVATFKA